MGRINIQKSGEYQSSTSTNYFQLKDDKDSAEVVFLYDDPTGSDIDYYLCHQVEIDNYPRWVNCNAVDEDGNDHPDDCALCREGFPRQEKLFLQLYNLTDDKKQLWDRGSKFVGTISSYIERYGSLVNQPLEVVRNGRKGDQATTYQLFATDPDDEATVDSYGGRDDLLGSFILDLTEDEMYDAIDGKYHMPGNDNNSNNNSSNRRRGGSGSTGRGAERTQRSTPSSRTSRRATNEAEESSSTPTSRGRGTSRRTARTESSEESSPRTARRSTPPSARRTSPRR